MHNYGLSKLNGTTKKVILSSFKVIKKEGNYQPFDITTKELPLFAPAIELI